WDELIVEVPVPIGLGALEDRALLGEMDHDGPMRLRREVCARVGGRRIDDVLADEDGALGLADHTLTSCPAGNEHARPSASVERRNDEASIQLTHHGLNRKYDRHVLGHR